MDSDDVCTALDVCNATELYLKMVNFVIYTYHNKKVLKLFIIGDTVCSL